MGSARYPSRFGTVPRSFNERSIEESEQVPLDLELQFRLSPLTRMVLSPKIRARMVSSSDAGASARR